MIFCFQNTIFHCLELSPTMTNTDPDCFLPRSPSVSTTNHGQNPRKKRTKTIKIDSGLVPSSSTTAAVSGVSKPKYCGKKADPSAPKITRPCSECGKKFWSWKALFGHMRCHPERQWRGINPPPNYKKPVSPPVQEPGNIGAVMSADDHEVASCLLLLANSNSSDVVVAAAALSETQDEGNCHYECSSCKKVFGSHQALGGHRASHKNVKGCFAITKSGGNREVADQESGGDRAKENVEDEGNNKMLMALGHECSVCLRVFSSGQALGGHKRCRCEKGEEESSNAFAASGIEDCGLDLNLPAPVEDESSSSYSSGLTLDLRLGL